MSIQFNPLADPTDHQCAICHNTSDDTSWVVHDADTTQEDEKIQHCFHKACLKEALANPNSPRTCPLCRDAVDLTSLFTTDEIEQFKQEESNEVKKVIFQLNKALLYQSLGSIAIAMKTQVFFDYFLEGSSWTTTATSSLISSIAVGYFFNNPFAFSKINISFFGIAASVIWHINPLSLPTDNLTRIIYPIMLSSLAYFYLPVKSEYVPSDGQSPPRVFHRLDVGIPIIGIISTLAWQYFRG